MLRSRAVSSDSLADRLTTLVVEHLESFVRLYAPGFVLPRAFAGYPVGSDVHADLAFSLAHLRDVGVDEVAGIEVDEAIGTVLMRVEGASTHTFFSYRVAETMRRFGLFDDNRLLARLEPRRRADLADACDSTSWLELLDAGLPANYAAVLARCEVARRSLGLEIDEATLDELLARTRRLLGANPAGYLDDSEGGRDARYDIYTADVYLFTEPLAAELEPIWTLGARSALDLVARVSATDGSAMTWGRSLGCLALCHTIELTALALDRALVDDLAPWLVRADRALAGFASMTDGVLVDAHRHRGQNAYRGPDRWLQLTFDCFGKLAWAASRLGRRAPFEVTDGDQVVRRAYPARDEMVWFDEGAHAGVWTYRSPATAFVLPFVGTAWSDYLPAPRNPTLYEVPVDAPLPNAVPTVTVAGSRYVGGGLPEHVEHSDGRLDARWAALPRLVPTQQGPALDGRRDTTYRVEGHVLTVHERLHLPAVPDAVGVQITETADRPLRVEAESSTGCRVDTILTEGLPAYRSFWSELPRVHQIDVEPAQQLELRWSVRPLLRLATADPTHHYHRSLYDNLGQHVVERAFGAHLLARPEASRRKLASADAFHLHWPEWFVDTPEQARTFVELLHDTETLLVWTQHNLRPHREVSRADELYQVFAAATDVVVHHSEWGRRMVTQRYGFADHARHVVLPHGHFGDLFEADPGDRRAAEDELGLPSCTLRIGIVGAPRREKQVQAFMEAFAATSRDDIGLVVLSLDAERVPDDRRIVARTYEFVPRTTYNRRLAAFDVIALPFDPAGEMLTTGVVGDVVGLGLPAIVTDWPYLTESLGAAGLVYRSHDELVDLLESISDADLAPARRASRGLQATYAWDAIAAELFEVLVASGAFKG